ncbi:MAG: HEAT repeat domain-containing protein [Chloroflexi bacterium]|nr:HEAT repeat domain-containing protein [Chloroflexota bacterium]
MNDTNPNKFDNEDNDFDDEFDADDFDIDNLDDDDDLDDDPLDEEESLPAEAWDDENYAVTRTTLTAEQLLHRLLHDPNDVTGNDLFAFSDLTRQIAEKVRQDWLNIPVERRRIITRQMVDSAFNDLDWHLSRFLRIALEDQDAEVRLIALEGLAEDTSNDLIGPLLQLMRNDQSTGVRAAAARNLGAYVLAGELDELDAALAMRVEEALLAILSNPNEPLSVQSQALESIAYSGEAGVRQLIEDAYYSPDEEIRVSSLIAMGRSADIHWRNYARAELLNPSPAMRAEAARTCGELETKAAIHELVELIIDEEQTVRLAAIFALGRIGGRDARAALNAISESGKGTEAAAAEEALEEMSFYTDPNATPLYDETEDDSDDWDVEAWHNIDRDDIDEKDMGEYEE